MPTFSSIYLNNIIVAIITLKIDQLFSTLLNGKFKILATSTTEQ